MMRETEYSAEEARVCAYLQEHLCGEIGCGDDPIGFLIASHRFLQAQAMAARVRQEASERVALLPEQG